MFQLYLLRKKKKYNFKLKKKKKASTKKQPDQVYATPFGLT